MPGAHSKDPNAWYGPAGAVSCIGSNVSRGAPLTNGAALVSGRLEFTSVYVPGGANVQDVKFFVGTTAAITPTHAMAGIYSPARALLATSVDITTTAWAANTMVTVAVGVGGNPWLCPASDLYYVGLFIVASTMPTFAGNTLFHVNQGSDAPILCGTSDTGLTTALPNPAAAITATTAFRAVWLTGT